MIAIILSLMLSSQGIPIPPQQAGTVSGILKDGIGRPLPGIRMTAVTRPDSLSDLTTAAAMASITQTDAEGRYKLENIPPGRYFIAAGRLDVQTYYPGSPDPADAKDVAVTAGVTVSDIDFAISDISYGRAGTSSTIGIPIQVSIEGGGTIPVSANGGFVALKLEPITGNAPPITTLLSRNVVNVPGPQISAYRVTIENLPQTYVVKSMTYGTTNLLTDPLRMSPSDFPAVSTQSQTLYVTRLPDGSIQASASIGFLPAGSVVTQLPQDPAALSAYLAGLANGTGQRIVSTGAAPPPANAPQPKRTLSITLGRVAPQIVNGVRVSGRFNATGARLVELSGIPGYVYADGTFEVFAVPPGRHVIVTRNNPNGQKPQAASVSVGDRDLGGIVLSETALIPISPPVSSPISQMDPGLVPLGRIYGTILEELSHQPVLAVSVLVKGDAAQGLSIPVDSNGHFETPLLLPGVYALEVQIFGHSSIHQSVEVGDKDLNTELYTTKLY